MAADGQRFCLKWNDFRNSVTAVFEDLRQDEELVDITLCCEGKKVKAHRMMLSACSPYFRELLKENPCQHPVFFLKDTTYVDLKAVVEFVYNGEVNVTQGQLSSFLKTAEMLQVRGLTGDDEKESQTPAQPPPPVARHPPMQPMSHHPPPRHRPGPVAPPMAPRVLPPTPMKRPLAAPQPAPTPPKRPPPPPPPPTDSDVYVEPVVVSDSPEPPPPASPAAARARQPSGSSGGGPATPAGSEPSGDAVPSPAESATQPPPPPAPSQLPPLQMQPAVQQQQQQMSDTVSPLPAGPEGRDPAVKVEKVDITDDDVSLEQALGQVVNYEGSYDSEHSMSGMMHHDLSQGGGGLPLPGTSDASAAGVAAGASGLNASLQHLKWFPGKRCHICQRPFFALSTFQQHQALHRGETTCRICKRVFSQKLGLRRHMKKTHAADL
ncbi:broad-complex core protein isoforms 1/2/3/4/5-like isoform X7 [Amphibalanus amphitrite]|uniref:broad-complex core protein isoforms 1/2/3/4/5-like isoform X7 n=1 Tax=Amphibalanus amphitrite TaxID=1232801 RepID=UPI001C928854|nr:broad-complex core protein isoforms 1/2/3/4/5-like isoform X7 [Amphibalanus amphitrite]XP_043240879.1 broad-complex core protein isoforms 1/2/3/4/5-like isoform X7 [Amphibalanus amphitrite]